MNGNYRKDGVSGWSTRDEQQYIKRIGEAKKRNAEGKETVYENLWPTQKIKFKIKMLRGYLAGADQRVNWGLIDRKAVMDLVHRELARLEG
jgi:hypothetical protein